MHDSEQVKDLAFHTDVNKCIPVLFRTNVVSLQLSLNHLEHVHCLLVPCAVADAMSGAVSMTSSGGGNDGWG